MNAENVLELALDSLYDSLKILALALVIYVLLSFFEGKIAKLLEKGKHYGPFFGSLVGAIPQCGMSVIGSDLYLKRHLTLGTLIAIFLSTSDEAFPVLLGDFSGKWYMAFAVLGIKIVAGTFFGFLVDLLAKRNDQEVEEHLEGCEGEKACHKGCCGHEIEEEHEGKWHEHLFHPLVHSLKIFLYSYLVSFLFGLLILGVGEDNIQSFLTANYYLSPLAALVIGMIPNCASSVLLSDLYIGSALPFGALLTGLAMNAGLGPLYLFRSKKNLKEAFMIMGILIFFSLVLGYSFIWVSL